MERAKEYIVLDVRPDATYTRHSEGDFLRLADGRILFAYCRFTGNWHDNAPCDLVGMVSCDEGETWSEPRTLISASSYGVDNIMSLSMLQMQNGDVGLFYIIKQSATINRIMLSRSKDGGMTFYRHVECTLKDRHGLYVVNNDRVERLQSGRLMMPLAFHRCGQDDTGKIYFDGCSSACFLYSDDDGETWQEAPDVVHPPFTDTKSGLQEPGVQEMRSGVLWAYYRTDKMYQYESFSLDGGLHWTAAQPSRFTSPLSPMKIKRNPFDGSLVSIWNPTPNFNGRTQSKAGWGRTPFVYATSMDDGATWSAPLVIEDHPDHGYCYPAILFVDAGTMLVSYCSGGPEDKACLARLSIMKISL